MKKFILFFTVFLLFLSNSFDGYCQSSDGHIYMEDEFLDSNLLRISVFAEDFEEPILGIAFHLLYDFENVAFLRYDPGQFLERGGDPFYLVQNSEVSEKIIFGATLRREDNFPVGEGKIADFYFQILDEDVFDFSFENGVVSTLDVVRQDLDEVFWENFSSGRDDSTEIVFSSNLNTSVSSIENEDTKQLFVPLFMVAAATLSAFFIIYFIKKQEKKRPDSSVNFK